MSEPYSRKVTGRGVRKSAEPVLTIMWTHTQVPSNVSSFIPNYCMPLLFKQCIALEPNPHVVNVNLSDVTAQDQSISSETCVDNEIDKSRDLSKESLSIAAETEDENNVFDPVAVGTPNMPLHKSTADNSVCESDYYVQGQLDGGFLETDEVVQLLLKSRRREIPCGTKDNVYFVINNTRNIERRHKWLKSEFSDDCGVYISTSERSSIKS